MKLAGPMIVAAFLAIATQSVSTAGQPSPEALLAQNKELVKKFFAAFTSSVYTGVPDPQLNNLVAEGYVQHESGVAPGIDGLKAMLLKLHSTIPDLTCKVSDIIAESDRVVDRTECSYHDRRSNQTVTDISIDEFRVSGGKLAEHTNWSE